MYDGIIGACGRTGRHRQRCAHGVITACLLTRENSAQRVIFYAIVRLAMVTGDSRASDQRGYVTCQWGGKRVLFREWNRLGHVTSRCFGLHRMFFVADDVALRQYGDDGAPGDRERLDALVPLVYAELRQLAARQLRGERTDHTLQTTALAHEAYLRLAAQHQMDGSNRQQVLALSAVIMRRILTDHARRRAASKRAARRVLVSTGQLESLRPASPPDVDLLALDDALTRLARFDVRQARIVELRFFGGLTFRETAAELDISLSTAKREWAVAKAWLFRALSEAGTDGC